MSENHNCSNYGGEDGCTRCMKALRVEVKLLRGAIDRSNEALADALGVREERNRLALQVKDLERLMAPFDSVDLALKAQEGIGNWAKKCMRRAETAELHVGQMRPVVDAAIAFQVTQESCADLLAAVKAYQTSKQKASCPMCKGSGTRGGLPCPECSAKPDSEPSKCRSHDYSERFGGERICELCGGVEKRDGSCGP